MSGKRKLKQQREVVAVGDCFVAAWRAAVSFPGCRIVHGLPIGTGTFNRGKRYWHAWLETKIGNEDVCISIQHNVAKVVPRHVYYDAGQIETTFVFTFEEAALEMVTRGHYGPWVDDFERMGL